MMEALLPSTEKYDPASTAGNIESTLYRTLPPLQEYALAEQDCPFVTTFFRNAAGHWKDTDVSVPEQNVRLRSVDGTI